MLFQAIYFDGVSSSPNPLEVFFNPTDNTISFTHDGQHKNWDLKSVVFEKFASHLLLYAGELNTETLKIEDSNFIITFKELEKFAKEDLYLTLQRLEDSMQVY